jgi:hypothetical protein
MPETEATPMTLIPTRKCLKERRRAVLLWGLLVLLAGTGVGSWLLTGGGRITRANYDRITKGMTEEEVTQILGTPSDFFMSRRVTAYIWKAGNREIVVFFTNPAFSNNPVSHPENGHAYYKSYAVGHPILDSLPDSFRIPAIRALQYEEETLD